MFPSFFYSFTNVDFDKICIAVYSRATYSRVWQRRVTGGFISMTSAGITKKQASRGLHYFRCIIHEYEENGVFRTDSSGTADTYPKR